MSQSYYPGYAETCPVWAVPRSLATTCGITVVFSSSSYLDVSVQRVRSSFRGTIFMVGCPIRMSADYRLFAPPRGFSQLITSFFALQSLGIPRMPLFVFFARNCVFISKDRYVSTLLFYQCFDNVFSLLVVFLCLSIKTCFLVIVNMSMNLFLRRVLIRFISVFKHPLGVEDKGFEPLTPCLQSRCSSQLS